MYDFCKHGFFYFKCFLPTRESSFLCCTFRQASKVSVLTPFFDWLTLNAFGGSGESLKPPSTLWLWEAEYNESWGQSCPLNVWNIVSIGCSRIPLWTLCPRLSPLQLWYQIPQEFYWQQSFLLLLDQYFFSLSCAANLCPSFCFFLFDVNKKKSDDLWWPSMLCFVLFFLIISCCFSILDSSVRALPNQLKNNILLWLTISI